MKNGLLVIALAASVTTVTNAQSNASTPNPAPFGIPLGVSITSLRKLVPTLSVSDENKFVFTSTNVPIPNSSFDGYHFVVSPDSGLCRLAAYGKTYRFDYYGAETKAAYKGLQERLASKYGEPMIEVDALKAGSSSSGDSEWMKSLYLKERTLASYWHWEDSHPYGNLGGVSIEAVALDETDGYLRLIYEIRDFDACMAAARKADADAL